MAKFSDRPFAADTDTLFYLDNARKIAFTVEDSFTSMLFSGRTRAGKTRFGIHAAVVAMMEAGYGFLCACPKPDTASQLSKWACETGRESDFICINPDGKTKFDILSWLATRTQGPAVIKEATEMLLEIGELFGRNRMTHTGGDAKFFVESGESLNHAIMLCDQMANGGIAIERCSRAIQSLNQMTSSGSTAWSELAQKALDASYEHPQFEDVRRAADKIIEIAGLDPRVRGSITITASVSWAGLAEYPLNRVFGSPGVIAPEVILEGGIVCINLPLAMGPSAKVAFILWKLAVQKMLQARAPK